MDKQKRIAYKLYREKTINRIQKKVLLLGLDNQINPYIFLNTRFLIAIFIFLVSLFAFKYGYIIAPITSVLFYILFEIMILDLKIKRRAKKLEDEAIFFFEILGLTLESNKHLKGALELTTRNIDSELSSEFKKSLEEIKLGKSFTECLISMKDRIPSDSINSIILNLTESSIFGNNITETLNNQLDYLRDKKLLSVKAEINKLPTKISVISVLFFVPLMLLIILAPVLLEFLLN